MPSAPDNDYRDASVLVALVTLLFFASPLIEWWSREITLWYFPFLLWLLVIGMGLLIHAWRGRHGP